VNAHAAFLDVPVPTRGTALPLGGHSGAQVVLCAADDGAFVRKTAASPAANLRLRQQAIKQCLLAAQGFAFPAVRRAGVDPQRRAYFEMDYIPARTLGEIVLGAVPVDRGAIVEAVAALLRACAMLTGSAIDPAHFRNKIDAIAGQAGQRAPLRPHASAIAGLQRALFARDWSGIPQTPDHGDLTLENILLSPERGLVFIDCDVAWVSSWWLDLAKLFQDFEGHWCLRGQERPSVDALERLRLFAQDFRGLARALDPNLPPRLAQLAALHLFRVLPYARSAATAGFACAAAARLLESAP
jgi:hypothetical protein